MAFNFGIQQEPTFYKLLTYMGSKDKHIPVISPFIEKSKAKNYCEPFLGSGSIFLNLPKQFDNYYLNDLSTPMMYFYEYKTWLTPEFCNRLFDRVEDEYNLQEKQSFFEFRDMYNAHPVGPEKALYFLLLAAHSINGMVRFNKKGEYNQSFGNRKYNRQRTLAALEKIRTTENLHATNDDCFSILENVQDSIIFLDPPYIDAKMANDGGFNNDSLQKLISYMETTENDIIYTDTLNEYNKNLKGFSCDSLGHMIGTRPRPGRESTEEYIFWKIK